MVQITTALLLIIALRTQLQTRSVDFLKNVHTQATLFLLGLSLTREGRFPSWGYSSLEFLSPFVS
jgi:hypothetical protein